MEKENKIHRHAVERLLKESKEKGTKPSFSYTNTSVTKQQNLKILLWVKSIKRKSLKFRLLVGVVYFEIKYRKTVS
jgi:hypothetical protein